MYPGKRQGPPRFHDGARETETGPLLLPRWVVARTSRRAHLDLGERSSKSVRVRGDHIIVTACRAHIEPNADVVPASWEPLCSNCLRISRLR
jgi:hypothetical protein